MAQTILLGFQHVLTMFPATVLVAALCGFHAGTVLLASDKHKQLTVIAFVSIIINVTLNYFLIPYTQLHQGNGGIGSAIATLGTELFVMAAMLGIMQKDILTDSDISVQLKALGSGCFMALTLWLMESFNVHIVIQGVISGAAYGTLLIVSKGISRSDIAMIAHIVPDRFRKNEETLK